MPQIINYVDMLPGTDVSVDIGATTLRFRDLFVLTLNADSLALSQAGTTKATTDLLTLVNEGNAADMDGTGTAIRFDQFYYDATTPAVADAARIVVATETDWTSTTTTQDAYMAFQVALDGTVAEKLRITSGGLIGINTAAPGSMLEITPTAIAVIGQQINALSGQTGNLLEFRNSSDAIVAHVSAAGVIGGAATTGGNLTLTSTSHATKGKIYFGSGATSAFDEVNSRVGIGTASPTYPLSVVGSISAGNSPNVAAPLGVSFDLMLNEQGQVNVVMNAASSSSTDSPVLLPARSRGTIASPSVISSGDRLFLFGAIGYGNTGWDSYATGLFVEVDGAPIAASNHIPTRIRFVGEDSSGSVLEWMRLASSGNVGIGVTAPLAALHLKAGTTAASTAPLKFTSGPLLTAAEAGAIEFLTDRYYGTITTGAARHAFITSASTFEQGDVLYYDGSHWVSLPHGTSGQFLQTQGNAANPHWASATSALAAGSDTQVQFNDGGVFGADAQFTFDKTSGQQTLTTTGGETSLYTSKDVVIKSGQRLVLDG